MAEYPFDLHDCFLGVDVDVLIDVCTAAGVSHRILHADSSDTTASLEVVPHLTGRDIAAMSLEDYEALRHRIFRESRVPSLESWSEVNLGDTAV